MTSFAITSIPGNGDGSWRITVAGELDLSTSDQLRQAGTEALDKTDAEHLVIDLAKLEFIDSTGIGALVAVYNDATERGIALELANVPAIALRVLEITGLTEHFGIAPEA